MTTAPAPPHRLARRSRLVEVTAFALIAVAVLVLVFRGGTSSHSSAAIQGSGVAAAQTRSLPPFTAVDLGGSAQVTVVQGSPQRVVVRADDNLLERITTRVSAGTLVVGEKGNVAPKTPTTVSITVPTVDSLSLSGSGILTAHRVRTQVLDVGLPGSGILRASGSADQLEMQLGGSGQVQLGDLVARDVHAGISGSGSAVVTATNSLYATVSGSGSIVYYGDPGTVTSNVTGSGAITRGAP